MAGAQGQPLQIGQQSPNVGGDKGTGQPTHTAMGTPIVYGKTYLNPSNTVVNQMASGASPLSNYVQQVGSFGGGDGSSSSNDGVSGSAGPADGIGVGSTSGINGMDAASDAASAASGDGSGGGAGGK